MAQEILVDGSDGSSLLGVSLTKNTANKKSEEAYAASFQKLEEILEIVDKEEASGKSESAKAPLFDVESIMESVRSTLLKNPNDIEGALKLIAPFTKGAGNKVSKQLDRVTIAFSEFQQAVKGVSDEQIKSDCTTFLEPILSNTVKSAAALDGLLSDVTPLMEKLNGKDPSKIQAFADRLVPILSLIAIKNPEAAKIVLGDFTTVLEKQYELSDASQASFFSLLKNSLENRATESNDPDISSLLKRCASSETSNSSNMKGSLAMGMIFLQMFQCTLTQSQANQGKIQAVQSLAMLNSAALAQKNVSDEIAKAEAAAKAAASRPWWEKLVEVLVAVVGVVVAALTAGVGAALVAVAVGAFMASPAFNDAVQGLAAIIPGPFSEVIAKVIVLAIVMVVSCGLGGFTTAADATVDTAATAAAETTAETAGVAAAGTSTSLVPDVVSSDVAEIATDASESAAKTASKLRYSGALGLKMGLFQGLTGLTTSGIIMDIITTTSPAWAKRHKDAVLGLSILIEVIGVAATCLAGKVAFKGPQGATMLERLPRYFKGLIPASWGAQMGDSSMEVYLGSQRAGFLKTEAEATKELGTAEMNLSIFLASVDTMGDSSSTNNNSATSEVKALGEAINLLGANAANAWLMTAKIAGG